MSDFRKLGLFWSRVLLVLTASLAVCFGVDWWYRSVNGLEYRLPQNVLPKAKIETPYELVVMGNSHSADGVDLENINIPAIKLAGSGQQLQYDLAKLKHYQNQIADRAVVLINVSPISFSQTRTGRDDQLHTYYYGQISPIYLEYFQLGEYLEMEWLPFSRVGALYREQVAEKVQEQVEEARKEMLDQELETARAEGIVPEAREIAPDEVMVVTEDKPADEKLVKVSEIEKVLANKEVVGENYLNESMHFMFAKWNNPAEYSSRFYAKNRQDLEKILVFCKQKGWRPVLITVPISATLKKGLQDDFFQTNLYENLEKIELGEVEYWDFGKSEFPVQNSLLYSNSDHLNNDGAKVFSYLLVRKLIDRGYLPDSADGYSY